MQLFNDSFSAKKLISLSSYLNFMRMLLKRFLAKNIDDTYIQKVPYTFAQVASLYPVEYDWGKESFLKTFKNTSRVKVLDIGCGNDSPIFTKNILNDAYYIGLDVENYNQHSASIADEYILVSPENFAAGIEKYTEEIDVIISSHNLEHCDDRDRVLKAVAKALKFGGKLYLSFPCEASVGFPKRKGTLNYYDDPTHKDTPPDFTKTIATLAQNGLKVVYASSRYQSPVRWMIGATTEAESRQEASLKAETWAFWGFETIIWAEKA